LDNRALRRVAFRVPPRVAGDQDNFLIRADKNPNSLGAELVGLGGDSRAVLEAARARRLRCLMIFGHDLLASEWPAAEVREALGDESTATRAEHWFRQLVAAVPAFAGLSYQALGDGGRLLAGAVKA